MQQAAEKMRALDRARRHGRLTVVQHRNRRERILARVTLPVDAPHRYTTRHRVATVLRGPTRRPKTTRECAPPPPPQRQCTPHWRSDPYDDAFIASEASVDLSFREPSAEDSEEEERAAHFRSVTVVFCPTYPPHAPRAMTFDFTASI